MWRPKNWEKFRPELLEATEEIHAIYDRGIEVGASAILEALRETGISTEDEIDIAEWPVDNLSDVALILFGKIKPKGRIVFIPDEQRG